MAASTQTIQKMYIAYFGRPADTIGLQYWADKTEAQIIAGFSASSESQALFGNQGSAAKVNAIYNNLFARDAEPAGLQYWVQKLNSGEVSQAEAMYTILNNAGAGDATAVANKLAAAEAFTAQIDTTPEILGYTGANAAQSAREWLGKVNANAASLDAAKASAPAALAAAAGASAGDGGKTFTLTTGVDNVVGTAGNDTISATVVNAGTAAAGTGTTLAVSDIVDGGAGTDTLSLTVLGAGAAAAGTELAVSLPVTNNVETVSVKNLATGSNNIVTVNAGAATGLTTVANNGSTGAVAFTGVASNAAINVTSSNAATSVTYGDNAFANGGALVINANAAGVAGTNEVITVDTATTAGKATAATINVTGSNFVSLVGGASAATSIGAAAGVKTLTVTGTGSLNLNATSGLVNGSTLADDLTKLDASANTGGVTASVSNAKVVVNGGSGNDTISITGALATGASINLGAGNDKLLGTGSIAVGVTTIDGGEGVDAISSALVTAGNAANIKNFETLSLQGSTTLDASLLTGSTITTLSVDAASSGTYTGLTTAQSLTNTYVGDNSANTTELTFTGVTGTADAYTIAFNAAAQTNAVTGPNVQLGTIAAAGIENFNIVSGGGANTWNSLALGADSSAKTVAITGAQNLNLSFEAGFGSTTAPQTGVSSIDGSAATGALNINIANVVAATAGLTVKGGTAADTLTTSTFASTLTGGAGNDNFVVAGSAGVANMTTITDFTKGDKVTLSGSSSFATTKVDVGAVSTLTAALDLAAAGTTGTNAAWFQYGGNTYIVEDNNAATTFNAADVVVKLSGLVDLSTSTLSADALTFA